VTSITAPRHTKVYDPQTKRHPVCTSFEALLHDIVADQMTGNSHVNEAMRQEFGDSVAASIMMAADIYRLRYRHRYAEVAAS
jgi:(p)ppGpp synthase/HD superfamily hydrolase